MGAQLHAKGQYFIVPYVLGEWEGEGEEGRERERKEGEGGQEAGVGRMGASAS